MVVYMIGQMDGWRDRCLHRNMVGQIDGGTDRWLDRFQYAAAMEWNMLPLDIRNSTSVRCFKTNLKTHLFKQYFK